ncbi:MAG TPA: hypothetical protein VG985_01485 [Xanthobacteraceae bacterium]|nr:hypothetical protein [Xanthobacteraceae bacterium]
MASDNRSSEGLPGERARRPAPTIDLTATEVSTAVPEGASANPEAPHGAGPEGDPPPDGAAPGGPADTVPPGSADDSASDGSSPPSGTHPSPWPYVGAAVAGAAAVVGLSFLLTLTGWTGAGRNEPAGNPPGDGQAATLASRLEGVERQIQEFRQDLAGRAPPAVDPKALAELSARLDRTEAALARRPPAAADPALASRLSGTETTLKSLADAVSSLTQRTDDLAGSVRAASQSGDTGALAGQTAALETTVKKLAEDTQKQSANLSSGLGALRRALLAEWLRSAVERGEPFAAELAAVRQTMPDAQGLAPLARFADTGVPSAAALGQELEALVAAMRRPSASGAPEGGLLDRLQASAERLVRIQRVGEAQGDDPSALLGRVQFKAAHADIAGALADLSRLSPAARAPAEDWIRKAEARNAAVDAARRIATGALDALAKSSR